MLHLVVARLTYRGHIRDTEDETNCVQDVRFPRTIETGDGIERFIESCVSVVAAAVNVPVMVVRTG